MNLTIIYILTAAILLWLVVLSLYIYKAVSHYENLVSGTKRDNLKLILEEILKNTKLHEAEIEQIKNKLRQIDLNSVSFIQKVGILRFNPFEDTGGDQSFVLAILDGKDNGVVLTSLHGRDVTRWYAKNVREGKGTDHKLSSEEEKAIKQAVLLRHKKV